VVVTKQMSLLVKEINPHVSHRCNIGYDYDIGAESWPKTYI